jgi:hypothetical protein
MIRYKKATDIPVDMRERVTCLLVISSSLDPAAHPMKAWAVAHNYQEGGILRLHHVIIDASTYVQGVRLEELWVLHDWYVVSPTVKYTMVPIGPEDIE